MLLKLKCGDVFNMETVRGFKPHAQLTDRGSSSVIFTNGESAYVGECIDSIMQSAKEQGFLPTSTIPSASAPEEKFFYNNKTEDKGISRDWSP